MFESAYEWAEASGPPNWVFLVAVLTSPRLWARYVKRAANDYYTARFEPDD